MKNRYEIDEEENENENPALTKFKSKFSLPQRPSNDPPEIPPHLDELHDSDLMDIYSEFMAWVSYTKSQLVQAEIDEDYEFNQCKIIESTVLIRQWGNDAKGDRVTIAKARRDVDPKVVEHQLRYQTARAYRKLTESLFESCERGAQLLSRELSRRIGLHNKEQRTSRFSA